MEGFNSNRRRRVILAGAATAGGIVGAAIGTTPLWLGMYMLGALVLPLTLVGATVAALALEELEGHEELMWFAGSFGVMAVLMSDCPLPLSRPKTLSARS